MLGRSLDANKGELTLTAFVATSGNWKQSSHNMINIFCPLKTSEGLEALSNVRLHIFHLWLSYLKKKPFIYNTMKRRKELEQKRLTFINLYVWMYVCRVEGAPIQWQNRNEGFFSIFLEVNFKIKIEEASSDIKTLLTCGYSLIGKEKVI